MVRRYTHHNACKFKSRKRMALNSLICADVLYRIYLLYHKFLTFTRYYRKYYINSVGNLFIFPAVKEF